MVSGAVAFAYEILWARLLGHVLGGSLYAFATMLAAFLLGIALGGLGGAALAKTRRSSALALAACEVATGVFTAITFFAVEAWSTSGDLVGSLPFSGQVVLCVLVLLPATLCLGATFPLAVRSLAEGPGEAGLLSGRVYSWNTLGAIIGAVGAGYFLIPAIGFALTFKVGVVLNLFLGAVVLIALRPVRFGWAAAVGAVALAALILYRPSPPLGLITNSPIERNVDEAGFNPALLDYKVGHSATVALMKWRGSFVIRTNGLPEALVYPKGGEALPYSGIRWMTVLPKILRPETESMLVVGFGSGEAVEAVPEGINTIDVIELEEEVLQFNREIASERAIDPLADPRITVIVNDARGALRLTDKHYGAIVSQPSHPWTAGASHLYTQEFVELAAEHLTEDGVLVQWLGVEFVDERLLGSYAATLLEVFPHVQLYRISSNFLFVASPTSLEDPYLPGVQPDGSLFHLSGQRTISYVEDVLAVLKLDEAGCRLLAQGHAPITDDRNLMATHGAMSSGPFEELTLDGASDLLAPYHFLNRDSRPVLESLADTDLDYAYLAESLAREGGGADLVKFRTELLSDPDRWVAEAQKSLDGSPETALAKATQALEKDPGNADALVLAARARIELVARVFGARRPPIEFSELTESDSELATSIAALPDEARAVLEAEFWARTGQVSRVAEVLPLLEDLDDTRSPLFGSAMRARLQYLISSDGKSQDKREADHLAAAKLLDRVLAVPELIQPTLIAARLQLAQAYGDIDYQIALGWFLAVIAEDTALKRPGGTNSSRFIIGKILSYYRTGGTDSDPEFSDTRIADFFQELRRDYPPEVLPKTEIRSIR